MNTIAAKRLRAKGEEPVEGTSNKRAPDGQIYVCFACGKVSRWRYGIDDKNRNDGSPGWDEACVLNCALVDESRIKDPPTWEYPQRVRNVEDREDGATGNAV